MNGTIFIEALNSIFGLLLIFYCIILSRSYRSGVFHKGFKYMLIVALLITIREATYLFSYITGIDIFRDLITSLTIIALTYSVIQFKEQTISLISSVKDRRLLKLFSIK